MEFIILLISFVLISLTYVTLEFLKHRQLPPGPICLPIVGYTPFLKTNTARGLARLRDKYGDIVHIKVGMRRAVILFTYDLIREALVTQSDNFCGRNNSHLMRKIIKDHGIFCNEGHIWQTHRRFSIGVLKSFTTGMGLSQDVIKGELLNLLQELDKWDGKKCAPTQYISKATSDIISILTMGFRITEEPEMYAALQQYRDNTRCNSYFNNIPMYLPYFGWFAFLLFLNRNNRDAFTAKQRLQEEIQKKINEHRDVFQIDAEPTDYCEAFLREKEKSESSEEKATFSDVQLCRSIHEFFIGGACTSTNVITYFIVYLSQHPHVQEKVQAEIDSKIGHSRFPVMADRNHLDYCMAVMDEVMRLSSILLVHENRNFQETGLNGYRIPPNTLIYSNYHAVNHDATLWSHPDELYPAHFLDEEGKYCPKEYFTPFGIGQRSCIGESLAKIKLFIFFTLLFQRYTFKLVDVSDKKFAEMCQGGDGSVKTPGDFEVFICKR